MKVYRGYNKEIGPISYPNWIYVTADPEQAKYYATKDGFVKDGAIIEYDMDKEHMSWISLSKINSFAESDNEYYTEEDLLWYQEELAYSLKGLRDGIIFKDPYNKDHTIYIVFDKSLLLNGRVLSKEEFDAIQLKESAYDNEINEALRRAGIQLDEKVITVNAELADTQLVTSPYELNEIIENHPEKRIIYDMEHNWFLVGNSETSIHIHLVNDALQDGIYAPFEYNGELIDGSQEDDGDTYCDLHSDELVLFVTSANTEKNVHYLEDNYYYTYVYKDYVVYDRKFDFRFTPLYKILGKPLSVTYWDGFNKKDMLKESYQLTEREDLTNFNRIAGFYHLKTKKFELFPRTSEDISVEDDEVNDYIHNIQSKDEFTEFNIVRFGIEDITGEGVVCYIEGDTKRNVEKCYYAILEKYAEECDIIKYELEYYVGNEHKYIFLDRYGNQIMESLNEAVTPEQVPEKLYHATFSKLLRKIKKCGYLGNSPYKLWSDSNNKYVYLATDPDEAYSYAETALDDCDNERLYDMLEDDDIVILEIDTKYLDKNKIFRDENVVDGETTYQYKGIINCQIMKIYKPTLDESVEDTAILKNPTRNELKRYNVDKWRLLQDIDGNYYFADAFKYTHDMMSNKLRNNSISAVDANIDNCGIILYNVLTNTFYYRLLGIIDYEDVEKEYNESYLSKEFPNADLSSSNDDVKELNESVIRRDGGEVGGYYTQSTSDLLNIINNKYKEDDIRVLYDMDKKIYVFADTYSAIHFNLILYMILYTNVYDNISEIKNNKYESDEVLQDIIKSKLYLASFKIFRNYGNDSDEEFINFLRNIPENTTDGYAYGFTCKINDNLWAICRDDEIGEAKQVPLLQNKTWINLNDNNY